jgi:hypothetical protein
MPSFLTCTCIYLKEYIGYYFRIQSGNMCFLIVVVRIFNLITYAIRF